jgi:hypothetical protein
LTKRNSSLWFADYLLIHGCAATVAAAAVMVVAVAICRLAGDMNDFGCVDFKQFVQPILQVGIFVEAPKMTPFPGYVDADVRVDGEGEEDDKPDWAIEDGNAENVPVDGHPAP